jgi:hypothetical protein
MEIVIVVGLIAVVWYLTSRDGDDDSDSRVDTRPHHPVPRPSGPGTTTGGRPDGARGDAPRSVHFPEPYRSAANPQELRTPRWLTSRQQSCEPCAPG